MANVTDYLKYGGAAAFDPLLNGGSSSSKSTPNAMQGDPRFAAPKTTGVNNAPKYNQGIAGTSSSSSSSKLGASGSSSKLGASGSSSKSSSSSSKSSSGSSDSSYLAYLSLIQAQQAAEQARAEEAARRQREAAQAAYDRGMNYLNDAYNTQMSTLGSNYNSAVGQLRGSYDNSAKKIGADAQNSLRQAYINRMMSEKNLGQQMAAQGLSGGASESTLAKLYNNYGNSRNGIETTKANNMSDLERTLNDNLANALQQYNSAVANANMQKNQYAMNLENALAGNQIAAEQNYQSALSANNSNYLNALSNAVANMAKFGFDPTQATNDVNLATVIQAASNAGVINPNQNNYAQSGNEGVINSVLNGNNNSAYLQALLKSLYGI